MSSMEVRTPRATEAGHKKSSSSTLTAHGDGTYHVQSGEGWGGDGRTEHASLGHALMHLAMMHGQGDHMHIEGHDEGYTSHHVKEGKKVQGPHDHKTMRELKRHVAETMDEEEPG